MLIAGWLVALLLFGIGVLGARISLERLVDIQHERHHDLWIADDRPVGGRRTRSEISFWISGSATQEVFGRWLFRTPLWARSNVVAEAWLKRMRVWSAILAAGLLAGVMTFMAVIR